MSRIIAYLRDSAIAIRVSRKPSLRTMLNTSFDNIDRFRNGKQKSSDFCVKEPIIDKNEM